MSDPSLARRIDARIYIAGCDVTDDVEPYLISCTFTDNEEDDADDLQVKLQDRDERWQNEWLNDMIQSAISSAAPAASGSSYKVTAEPGLRARSGPGTQYAIYGTMPYGTVITVKSITNGWANFTYSGKGAYCDSRYLQQVSAEWNIGDQVTVTGTPQYTSYGTGTPGHAVVNYSGTISHLNLQYGVPYPIGVDSLGWFAISEVTKTNTSPSTGTKGTKLQAVFIRRNWKGDGSDEVLETGEFELDSIKTQGPPMTVTIKGTSLPFQSTIRKDRRSRVWAKISLSEIVREIASAHGMGQLFICTEDPDYDRIEQYRQTDIAFLQQLCHDAGCSLKVTNNILVVFDQSDNDAQSPVCEIPFLGITKYDCGTNENNAYTSCIVKCTKADGTVIKGTAYVDDYKPDRSSNKALILHRNVSSQAEAERLAQKLLRLHNKYEYKVSITLPFDPNLCAGSTVTLASDWGMWAGKYVIKTAQHKIDTTSTTQLTLRKAVV